MSTSSEDNLPILIKQCNRLIDTHIDRILKDHSIARSQYRVLYFVNKFGEPTQKELGDAMQVRASTVTLFIDALVQKGWLIRTKSSGDKRSNSLSLSGSGQKLFKSIPEPAKGLHESIVKNFSKDEVIQLEHLLKKMMNELEV